MSMKIKHEKKRSFEEKTDLPSWVTEYLNNLSMPEKKIIAQRITSYAGMREIFLEIDRQLPSYDIDIYKEILKKLPSNKILHKAEVLKAIEGAFVETSNKFGSLKTPGNKEILRGIRELFQEIEEYTPFRRLRRKDVERLFKDIGPDIDVDLDKRLGRYTTLAAIIDSAVLANPAPPIEKEGGYISKVFLSTRDIRKEKKRAEGLQKEIKELSIELISKIDEFNRIREKGFIDCEADLDLFYLIERAAQQMAPHSRIYRYEHYIEPHIKHAETASNLNSDYYPSLPEILASLSNEIVRPIKWTRELVDWKQVLTGQKTSPSDCALYLCTRLKEAKKSLYLPESFDIPNESLANIITCILSLEDGGMSGGNIRKIKEKLGKK